MKTLPAGMAAVILSAGQSSRMQMDPTAEPDPRQHKALQPFPRQSLIELQVETYLSAGVERVYCVLGWGADTIRQVVEARPGVEIVFNNDWPSGMFSSVRAGLRAAASASAVFLQPVDVPPPTRDTIIKLAESCDQGIAQTTYRERGGHPLCISADFAARIAGKPLTDRLDRIIRAEPATAVNRVKTDDARCLHNLNTPQDWLEYSKNS
jgi:nicotine blue oxidoreductase